jgi:hypothetical protein
MSNHIRHYATMEEYHVQAEGVGFEPTEHFCSRVFETRAFGRAMLPLLTKEDYSTAIHNRQTGYPSWLTQDVFSTTRK